MSLTDRVDGRSVGVATVAGVAAYLLGYLVTYVTQRNRVEERLRNYNFVLELLGNDPVPATHGVGWLFYNAHFVDTVFPTFGGTEYVNFIAESDGGELTVLYLVPPVVLLLAAVAVATLASVDGPADGAGVGVLLVAGYLPAAIAGLVAFAYATGGGDAVRPDWVTGVLLAGVVYPAVFGALGGGIAGFVRGLD